MSEQPVGGEPAPALRYIPNHRDVAFEDFGNEVVLIHFGQGRYFRLDEAARQAWSALEDTQGGGVEAIAERLAARYDGSAQALRAASTDFVAALREHELVVPWTPEAQASANPNSAAPRVPATNASQREPLRPPTLEVFTDLQDLLLLDPIHDVPESGWPHAQA